jgi:transcriptional regulator with XRE-family HTH domain
LSYKEELGPEDKLRGLLIRTLREEADLSRVELGHAIGRSEQLIGAIERGTRRPTRKSIAGIASALGIEPSVITAPGHEQTREPAPASDPEPAQVKEAA